MRVLVQGWDKSTIIAQVISWAMLSICSKDGIPYPFENLSSAPGMVKIAHEDQIAIIAVVYDNILIISNGKKLYKNLTTQLKDNTRKYNVRFKYIKETVNSFSFCGIEGHFPTPTNNNISPSNAFFWRIAPEVFESWNALIEGEVIRTPAEVMQVFGFLSRTRHVQLRTLSSVRPFLKKLSLLCKHMHDTEHKLWSTPSETSSTLGIDIINIFRQEINNWTTFEKKIIRRTLVIVTDASNDKLGYYIMVRDEKGTYTYATHRTKKRCLITMPLIPLRLRLSLWQWWRLVVMPQHNASDAKFR